MKTLEELGLPQAETYRITVKIDTNDADYNEKSGDIDAEELKELLNFYLQEREEQRKARFNPFAHSREFRTGIRFENYSSRERERDESGKIKICEGRYIEEKYFYLMLDYCPYNEWGFHTIESIEISPWVERLIF